MAMSRTRDPFTQETVVPFPNGVDAMDAAGQVIFNIVQRAAIRAEQNLQHARGMAHRYSLQLLAAQERIAELEKEIGQSREKIAQAEQWMQRIGALVEQRFLASDDIQSNQAPTHAVGSQDYASKRRYNL